MKRSGGSSVRLQQLSQRSSLAGLNGSTVYSVAYGRQTGRRYRLYHLDRIEVIMTPICSGSFCTCRRRSYTYSRYRHRNMDALSNEADTKPLRSSTLGRRGAGPERDWDSLAGHRAIYRCLPHGSSIRMGFCVAQTGRCGGPHLCTLGCANGHAVARYPARLCRKLDKRIGPDRPAEESLSKGLGKYPNLDCRRNSLTHGGKARSAGISWHNFGLGRTRLDIHSIQIEAKGRDSECEWQASN